MKLLETVLMPLALGVGYQDRQIAGELCEGFAAHAAGCHRRCSVGDDGDGPEFPVAGRHGRLDRAALGADAKTKGTVLDVAAGKDGAVGGQERGADPEAAVGSVGPLAGLGGDVDEMIPFHREETVPCSCRTSVGATKSMRQHREILIWTVLGLAAVMLVVWAFPRALPLLPGPWEVSEAEAEAIALEAFRDLGDRVEQPYVVVRLTSRSQLERRLQMSSRDVDPAALVASRLAPAQLVWDVLVFAPAVPAEAWTYRALISLGGEVLMLRRNPAAGGPFGEALDAATARQRAAQLLALRGFDLASFDGAGELYDEPGARRAQRLELVYREAVLGPRFPYGVEVYFDGGEVLGYGTWYEEAERAEIRKVFRHRRIFSLVLLVLPYLLVPVVAVPFFRLYHDGQLGVRRGVEIFFVVLTAGLVYVFLTRHAVSEGMDLGFVTRRQTTWLVFGFRLFFLHLGMAVLALTAWSVGELFCRRTTPAKLAAVDALLSGEWGNATVARSALRGTAGALVMAGTLLALSVLGQGAGVWVASGELYGAAAGHGLGWLVNLSQHVAEAVPLYLFAVFVVPCWARERLGRPAALALAYLSVVALAPRVISLPLQWGWVLWAVVAVVPVLLFATGDVLSAVLAGFLASVALQALPAVFASDPMIQINGYAALALAASPLVLSLRHLSGGEEHAYRFDDVPAHVRKIAERERQRLELLTAAEIQSSILPQLPPQLNGVEIASAYLPATEVGGDFYDVVALEDGRLAVAVGDVAGHGVASGLVMSMARSALAVQTSFDPEVEAVLVTLNRIVYQNARRRLLTTLCYALVDPERRELRYASAGHLYPYRISLGGEVEALQTASYPLGVRSELRVDVKTVKLLPSDALFLCSDGLVEAHPVDEDEPFGFERLEACLARHAGTPPQGILDGVLGDVMAYLGCRPWEDDVTAVVLRLPAPR